MPDDPIHQPHDKLFKQSFGDPVNAAGFLRHHLPSAIAEAIDWERLALQPGSFVDSHFRQHESDLLFSASIGEGDCLVYLLFEHQVSEEPLIALRLLRYLAGTNLGVAPQGQAGQGSARDCSRGARSE